MENITKEQADIIGEVANICTGTAATALSMIINRSTNITTPLVEVLDKENTLESDNHILVKVPYTSGLDGTNLMVLDVQDALVIASLMMGGDGRNLSNLQLDDLTLSAIAEAMNQMRAVLIFSKQIYQYRTFHRIYDPIFPHPCSTVFEQFCQIIHPLTAL